MLCKRAKPVSFFWIFFGRCVPWIVTLKLVVALLECLLLVGGSSQSLQEEEEAAL
jgi:hypothetical protein